MNSIVGWLAATGIAIMSLAYPQNSTAEGFTGKEFLTWNTDQRRSFLKNQFVMAGTFAARVRPEMAQCVSDHFLSGGGIVPAREDEIISTIADYAEYHPSSILVVMIENACGKFG